MQPSVGRVGQSWVNGKMKTAPVVAGWRQIGCDAFSALRQLGLMDLNPVSQAVAARSRHRFANAFHLRGERGSACGDFSKAKRGILVAVTITSSAASDTITITMIKNGSATALTTQLTVNTLNATFTSSDTMAEHAFSVGAGDQIAIQIVQTTSTPIVRLSMSTYCQ